MVIQSDSITTFSSQVKRNVNLTAFITKFADTGTYEYIGNAVPGSSDSSGVWQIKRITVASGDILFASGNLKFDKIWDDRAGYGYS